MRCLVLFIFIAVFNDRGIAQNDSNSILGKWKAIYEYNADSSYFSVLNGNHEYIYQFNDDGNYILFHIAKNNNSANTYKTVGKWKVIKSTNELMLSGRSSDPPRLNTTYADLSYRIVKLEANDMSLSGNFSIQQEGGQGTWKFKRMK